MIVTVLIWGSYLVFIVILIAVDLGLIRRTEAAVTVREALTRWFMWLFIALTFNVYIYFLYETNWLGWGVNSILDLNGKEAATLFFTGYLIELSLSVDNVFVFALIFEYMRVPAHLQYRVLFWGILGAIILRGVMISLGVVLITQFEWMTYVFGIILLLSAARMLTLHTESGKENIGSVTIIQKFIPVVSDFRGTKFFVIENGRYLATPLFLTLVMVEWADIIFAVDSIPAIFAVTTDPFLIFTSNIFAILGLRSLYFLVSIMLTEFSYLKNSIVFILLFVGIKMLLQHQVDIPEVVSLAVIAGSLLVGIIASLWSRHLQQK